MEPLMDTVTIHTAKTTLSQLLARVEAGEEIILARGKEPIAKLVPFQPAAPKRRFGALRGIISVGPEFFEPLSEEDLAAWE
jgi:prevent-host-death family protein